ncbi:MAG: M48 family metallopeptidase [Candidatus Zixiibacteriota bacterium]
MKLEQSKLLFPILLIIIFLAFQSCATTGPGGKKSLILISSNQEVAIGQELNQELQQSEKWLDDPEWQAYINEMGQKIVAVSDRKDIEYKFAVIESDQINAFAAPGGFVFFYTGLIKKMDNEAELAAVMAHEISHVVGRHSIKSLQSVMGLSLVLDLALGEKSDQTKALAGTALGIVMSGYSRSNEHEADDFGLTYMVRAGWNPDGMLSMFEKLRVMNNDDNAGFFEMLASSHPQTSDRISSTRERIKKLGELPSNLTLNSQKFNNLKNRL